MNDWIWIHYARARAHWYELPESERAGKNAAWKAVSEESRTAGGMSQGRFHVRGQSDFATVEIWNFVSADAAFDHWARLTREGYAEWFVSANNIGLRDEAPA